jgi:hypothetical protein
MYYLLNDKRTPKEKTKRLKERTFKEGIVLTS